MALDNTLNVEITASVEGLKSGLKQAESGIKGFSTETDKMVSKTNKMSGTMNANAVPAITSFSQVIQDAPYGIRGVANNIQQLTSQFTYLSKSSGGAGNALKAMIGSLTGPAGILLAVSLVTSLLISYGDEIANIGDETAQLIKKNEELAKSFGDTKTVLDAQIGVLDAQLSILDKQGVSTEMLLGQKLKLLESSLLTLTNQKEALRLQIANTKAVGLELSLWEKIQNAISLSQGLGVTKFAGLDNEELTKIKELETAFYDTEAAVYKTIEAIGKIKEPDIFDPKKGGGKSKKIDPNVIAQPLVTAITGAIPIVNDAASGYLQTWQNQLGYGLGVAKNTLEPLVNSVSGTLANVIPKADFMSEKTAEMLLALKEFNAKAKDLIENGIANTFSKLGTSIGEAMANGGNVLKSATSAIIDGLSDLLSAMGDYLIKAGTAAVLAGTVTKLFGSISGVGAGVAAISGGTFLKALASGVSGFGGAGNAKSGSDYSSSSSNANYGSSTSYASSSGTSGGTYVFEIAGTKLIGVLKNTLDRNRSLGGSNNLIFST